jgi:hypothetical protein
VSNPAVIVCPADTWTLVASDVQTGQLWKKNVTVNYLHTYRIHGDAAPTDLSDAVEFESYSIPISASEAIDVYVYAIGDAGSIRVDK